MMSAQSAASIEHLAFSKINSVKNVIAPCNAMRFNLMLHVKKIAAKNEPAYLEVFVKADFNI